MLTDAWIQVLQVVGILLAVTTIAALLVHVERRMLGIWQDRWGPNRLGPLGIGQLLADVIKLFFKEDFTPPFADKPVFILAPVIIMTTMLLAFAVIPFAPGLSVINLNIGLLFILGMSSVAVYSVLLAGYASNNKYALIGGLRAAAQTISYEVFMGISLLGVVMMAGSLNLHDIVMAQQNGWFFIPQCIGLLIFTIAGIAESHRLPFDLPEAEHELTAGFHTEYSGMKFGMFFVGEYLGLTLISALITTLFFGGWLGPNFLPPVIWFLLKTTLLILFFILLRAAIPRPRYDQLMQFGWLVMLPLALLNLILTSMILLLF